MDKAKSCESDKAIQHLSLLREQYIKLQEKCFSLEQKLAVASINSASDNDQNCFLLHLMNFISSLYSKDEYSDIVIKLKEGDFPGHKIVLAARGSNWSSENLCDLSILDFRDLEEDVGPHLLKWIYTDHVILTDFNLSLKLMKTAANFRLIQLVKRCEEALIALVNVKNCVQLYSTADEIGASTLKSHCSSLISTHWDDFTAQDFTHMGAHPLYEMFKTKTKYLLHSAVHLCREDVLFLFLMEFDSKLPTLLDETDGSGRLALDIALESGEESIAKTLIKYGASVNAVNNTGDSLIHCALYRGDGVAADFLIEQGCDLSVSDKKFNRRPIHILASQKYSNTSQESEMIQIAKLVIDKSDINVQDVDKKTPLHIAIESQKHELFDLLLNSPSINLNVRDKSDLPPLWYALNSEDSDNNDTATALINKGALIDLKIKETGDSLLHLLIKAKKENGAIFLVQNGASLSLTNKMGETPLHISCTVGLHILTSTLLKSGADPNLVTLPTTPILSINDENPFDDSIKAYRESPLHRAVRRSNYRDVMAILDYYDLCQNNNTPKLIKPNLDIEDSESLTPLGAALLADNINIATKLQEKGASVDQLNPEGLSLLHRGILQSNAAMALFLLHHKSDPNLRTRNGASPLQLSIEYSLHAVVEGLCEHGANLNSVSPSYPEPPLWLALIKEEFDIASILVNHNADVDFWSEGPSGCQQTLLHRAIDENREDIACFLIRSAASVNVVQRESSHGAGSEVAAENQTPLHLCCSWGLFEVVQNLLLFDAKLNVKDCEGKTPLHIALENGHQDIIFLLIQQSSLDLSLIDSKGKTAFSVAMTMKNNQAAQAILDRHPAAAEQYDNRGRTFLHAAIEKEDLESVLFLLGIHVSLTCRTKDERCLTPLHLATLTGSEMMVRNLVLAGASVNELSPQKETCLHLAAREDHPQLLSIFLENSINFDALDANFNNALHVAVKEGNLNCVKVLLTESQINANSLNLRGQNALHVLATYPKDNAAAIAELFFQALPEFPIDQTEVDGNTALLLAYMKGAGQLCRVLVRQGVCIGKANKHGVHLFNYEVASKTLLGRLLDGISSEPPWAEGEFCLECGCKFGIATRKHHCRHCGRLLCSKCSCKDIPIIKFHINKPVRACETCFNVITLGPSAFQ